MVRITVVISDTKYAVPFIKLKSGSNVEVWYICMWCYCTYLWSSHRICLLVMC